VAHEITGTDSLLLRNDAAWHGLGTIVNEDLGAVEGAERVGLLWHVDQIVPTILLPSGTVREMKDYRINVRADTEQILGVVSNHWQIVQNRELAEFADDLSREGKVTIETCGSIQGGAKVWFLLRGDSFYTHGGDETKQYICVSNGFDGKTAIRVTPTDVRVVCSNTLHAVIPRMEGQRFVAGENAYTCKHIGNIKSRINDVRAALDLFREAADVSASRASELAARQVSSAEMTQFFLEMYSRQFHDVIATDAEKKKKDKALEHYSRYALRFDRESGKFGATRWIMANAYTGWLQHDRKVERLSSSERKIHRRLFGTDIERSDEAFALALAT
jgi:phage/plasmid-like protein (TIGR03299 family)